MQVCAIVPLQLFQSREANALGTRAALEGAELRNNRSDRRKAWAAAAVATTGRRVKETPGRRTLLVLDPSGVALSLRKEVAQGEDLRADTDEGLARVVIESLSEDRFGLLSGTRNPSRRIVMRGGTGRLSGER